jgi:adenylosuccinate synthase
MTGEEALLLIETATGPRALFGRDPGRDFRRLPRLTHPDAHPFVTEEAALDLPEPHNSHNKWQGSFRTGHLDAVALRYAIEAAGGVDAIAVTHLDTAAHHPELRLCHAYQAAGQQLITRLAPGPARDLGYQQLLTEMLLTARPVYSQPGADWADLVEQETGAPVVLRSHGPTAADKTGAPGGVSTSQAAA